MADNEIPVQIKIIPPSQAETKRTLEDISKNVEAENRKMGEKAGKAYASGVDSVRSKILKESGGKALQDFKQHVQGMVSATKKSAKDSASVFREEWAKTTKYVKSAQQELINIHKAGTTLFTQQEKAKSDAVKAQQAKTKQYVKSAQQELINIHKAGASLFKQQEAAKTAAAKAEAKARTDAEKAAQGSVRKEVKKTADMYKEIGIKNPQKIKQDLKNIEKVQKDLNRQLKAGIIGFKEYNIAMREAQKRANLLEVGVSNARGAVGRFTASLASMSFELTGAVYGLTAIAGIIGGPAFFGTALLRKIEDAQFGISGILISMGQINGRALTFNEAMSASVEITDNLIESAYKYGVALDAITETFQATLAPGLAAGLNLSEIERIATIGTVAVKAIGLDSRQTVQEIRDLVAGGIQAASSTLARSLSLTDADIKRFTEAGTLFEELEKRLQGFAIVASERYKTLSGSLDLLKLKVQSLFADTSGYDVFKNIVQDISNAIGTFDAEGKLKLNPEVLKVVQGYWEIIKAIGTAIKDASLFIIDHIDLIKSMVKAWAAFKIGGAILGGVGTLAGSIATISAGMPKVHGAITSLVSYVTGLGLAKYGGLFGYLLFGTYTFADYMGYIDTVKEALSPDTSAGSRYIDKASKASISELEAEREGLQKIMSDVKSGKFSSSLSNPLGAILPVTVTSQFIEDASRMTNEGLVSMIDFRQKAIEQLIEEKQKTEELQQANDNLLRSIKARVDLEGKATEFREMADKSAKKTNPWEQYEDNIEAVRKKFAQFEKDYLEQVIAINANPVGAEQQEQLNRLAAAYISADNEVNRYIASQQELKAEAIEKYWAETAAAIRQTAKDTLGATLATAKSNEVDQNRLDIQNALVGIWKDYDSGISKLKKMYQASEDIEQTLVKQLKVLRDKEKLLKKSLDTPEKKARYAAVVEGILVTESLISTEKDKQKDIQKEINDLLDESENKLNNLVDANDQLYYKLIYGADALERIGMTAADQASYALEQGKRKTLELIDDMKLGVDGITDRFTSVFDDVLDGTKSLTESMKDMFNDLVNDIIKAFLKIQLNKLIGGISGGVLAIPGQSLAGSGGISSGGSMGIGDVSSLSNIQSYFGGNSIAQGLNTAATSLGFGSGAAAGSAAEFAAFDMVGFDQIGTSGISGSTAFSGSNLANLGAGILGGFAAGKIFDGEYASTGGSLGASIGMAVAGPIGAVVGTLLGGGLGSAIGGGRPAGYEEGAIVDLSTGGITQTGYKEGEKKFSQQNRDAADQLAAYFQALNASIVAFEDVEASTERLGIQISSRVDRLQQGVFLANDDGTRQYLGGGSNLQEFTEFAEETLFDLYNVNVEFYQGLTKEGETLGAAYERVKTSLAYVTELTDFLGITFSATGDEAEIAAAALSDAFGGLGNLTAASDFFYQNFYSEQEKLQYIVDANTATLAAFNDEMGTSIESRADLREYVESLDVATEAGSAAYANAMMLAPSLVTLGNALEQLSGIVDDSIATIDYSANTDSALADLKASVEEQKKILAYSRDIKVNDLLGQMQDIDAAQNQAKANLQKQLDGIDISTSAAISRVNSAKDATRGQIDAVRSTLDGLNDSLRNAEDILDMLSSAIETFTVRTAEQTRAIQVNAQKELLAMVASGQTPTDAESLGTLIGNLGNPDTRYFKTFAEFAADSAITANAIGVLEDRAKDQVSDIQQQINLQNDILDNLNSQLRSFDVQASIVNSNADAQRKAIQDQMAAVDANAEAQKTQIQEQIDAANTYYETEVAKLDDLYASSEAAIYHLRNIDEAIPTLADAIESLATAVSEEFGFSIDGVKTALDSIADRDLTQLDLGTEANWLKARKEGVESGDFNKTISDYISRHNIPQEYISAVEAISGVDIPHFASGGYHEGGFRIVGETGPELEYTPPSYISSSNKTSELLDTSAIVAEIKALKADMKSINYAIASNTKETAKYIKRWETIGMPETRTA